MVLSRRVDSGRGGARLVGLLALVLAPGFAEAQGMPLGPEFRINTSTAGDQLFPSVAADASGGFVVVWTSQTSGTDSGVFGQRYAASGSPLGPEFQVNSATVTTDYLRPPSVASDALGSFVVVWENDTTDGSSYGVFGQRHASSGAPAGPEFRVNTYTTSAQLRPSVASDPSGTFVVVWDSGTQDGSSSGVFGQRYSSSGAPLGAEFRVNTHTTGFQGAPSVACDSSGNFVVVWTSYLQDGSSSGVFGQRYSSSGAPLGPEFRVNTHTTNDQSYASVAADPSGNFVVAWGSREQDFSFLGVYAQRYASSGAPLGPEFRVNIFTLNSQGFPGVAIDSAGNFVVAWDSLLQDGPPPSGIGIYARRYASSGTPLGPEFRANTFTTGNQNSASVAADPAGNFVIAWTSYGQDGSANGVFGQRYSEIVPVELLRFSVE